MTEKKDNLPVTQLKALIEFRKHNEAPVDTMGCHTLGETERPNIYRFQTLISLILSAQTRDQQTSKAVKNLQQMKGGLTPEVLASKTEEEISPLIQPVGFYQKKAGNIIKVAQICRDKYNSDIPKAFEELTSLPGVGVKIATLTMNVAWKQRSGIGVDVHVHRIANRIGWCHTSKPDDTEKELQKIFPKEYWEPINRTLVGFGQTFCNAKSPKCDFCPIFKTCKLSQNDIEESGSD